MKKLRITKEQYERLLINEQRVRLTTLNEAKEEKIISHDDLDVMLTIGKLIGLPLTGKNKIDAEEGIKNPEILQKIKTIFENKEKLEELLENMEAKGMKDAKNILVKNFKRLITNYNAATNEIGLPTKLDFVSKKNINELNVN